MSLSCKGQSRRSSVNERSSVDDSRRAFGWLGVLVCLSVSGCFSSEYGRRMEQTIGKLATQGERVSAVFADPSGLFDAGGAETGISLRMPVFVDAKAKSLTAGTANAQPPFFNLPGFAYSYEIPFDGEPAYLYVAAVKAEGKPLDELVQEVQTGIAKKFSGAAWQDVTLETLSGASITLKRLSVTGPQQFGSEKGDGQFDLYLVSSANYHVLIGWRASAAVASAQGFFEKVAIAMGTVQGNT